MKKFEKKLMPALGVAAVGLLLAGCNASDAAVDSAPVAPVDNIPASSVAGMAAASEYADGTYAATGHYTSPAGAEEVQVTLTLAEGVVMDATFEGKTTHPTSMKRQRAFADGFGQQVIGKPIGEIQLGVVNGSSLVSKGFQDAVQKIEIEAEAA